MVNVKFSADVAELVDALDLGSSVFDVRVRVSPSAYLLRLCINTNKYHN